MCLYGLDLIPMRPKKKSALGYAQTYLTQFKRPAHIPIHKIYEGGKNDTFNSEIEVN